MKALNLLPGCLEDSSTMEKLSARNSGRFRFSSFFPLIDRKSPHLFVWFAVLASQWMRSNCYYYEVSKCCLVLYCCKKNPIASTERQHSRFDWKSMDFFSFAHTSPGVAFIACCKLLASFLQPHASYSRKRIEGDDSLRNTPDFCIFKFVAYYIKLIPNTFFLKQYFSYPNTYLKTVMDDQFTSYLETITQISHQFFWSW